ncbi:class I SAM-dependent methyltransferase [Salegentibacter chungangensis]|uniref:Class I SAM-dependent methyltransferase n=1 Tax=Salegentibacter chungangensis TaxID=1335724 RepID=A0ABW3NP65_9FLAO
MEKKVFLKCKDHLISDQVFELVQRTDLDILETRPVPENLEDYYKSEDYISHTDATDNLKDKVYRIVKNYMLGKKLAWISQFNTEGKILDIGAGTGDFLDRAKMSGWEVEGVEPNPDARSLALSKGVILKKHVSEITSHNFDVITMWHVLEHIPDIESYIENLKSLLNENGIAVIAVPNFKSHDAEFYGEFWAAYDVPRHLWHFSPNGIKEIFRNHGFELLKTRPLKFDSFYVSLLSEKYKSGKMNFPKAFYRGFVSNLKAATSGEYSSLVYFFKKA